MTKSRARSNAEWIHWGQTDPMHAVQTLPETEAGGARAWQDDDFLDTGRRYFADAWAMWTQYGVTAGHVVEIGCGSGRITRQLAERFERVTGVDVSSHQLAQAARLLGPVSERVSLVCVADPVLPLADGSCDAMYSCQVFQHLDPQDLLDDYLRQAFRVLTPRGTVCFQLPVQALQPSTFLSSGLRNGLLGLLRRLGRRRMMIYRTFEAGRVLELLETIGFVDVEMRSFRLAAQNGFHTYFFARTPPSTRATA